MCRCSCVQMVGDAEGLLSSPLHDSAGSTACDGTETYRSLPTLPALPALGPLPPHADLSPTLPAAHLQLPTQAQAQTRITADAAAAAAEDAMIEECGSEPQEQRGATGGMAGDARKESDSQSMMEADQSAGVRALGGDERREARGADETPGGGATAAGATAAGATTAEASAAEASSTSGATALGDNALMDSLPPVFVPVSGLENNQ